MHESGTAFARLFVIAMMVAGPRTASCYGVHVDPAIREMIARFDKAKTDPTTVDSAFDFARSVAASRPADPIPLVYEGSLAALKARDGWLPWSRLANLHLALDLMGQAADIVAKADAPVSQRLEVEMVRGITCAQIPTLFGQGSVARGDLVHAYANPGFPAMSPGDRATALAWLAVLARRAGDESASTRYLRAAKAASSGVAGAIWSGR
ncbi:uncharacterized protein E1O_26040 [Burkholderiales bacterium GJ-E10]|nr:uncharacterized protein E1O_26040 [Burkholderiales bacterium GJ-E10]